MLKPHLKSAFSRNLFPSTFLILFLFAAPVNADIATGLVGQWDFNEGAGDTVYDASGRGGTGTLSGIPKPTWSTSFPGMGKALTFDGNLSYVDFGAPATGILDFGTKSFSVAAWVYTNALGTNQGIVNKGSAPNANSRGYQLMMDLNGKITFYLGDGTNSNKYLVVNSSAFNLKANTWYHVVAVAIFNGTHWGDSVLYINGTAAVISSTLDQVTGSVTDSSNSFFIGRRHDGASYRPWNGLIDGVRVYDRALTASDVQELYNLGSGGLAGWWKFDEGSGTTVVDASLYGQSGGGLSGATLPAWVAGKVGAGALNFDGLTSNLQIPNNPILRPPSAVTYALWVKRGETQNNIAPRVLYKPTEAPRIFYAGQVTQNISIIINIGGDISTRPIGVTPTGVWTHVAASYNGTDIVTYINGSQTNTYNFPGTMTMENSIVYIGGYATREFNGQVDDVRIYSRALTANEIYALYAQGQPSKVSTAVVRGGAVK